MRKLFLLCIAFSCLFAVSAGAQSLAEIAAQTRAKQKANPNARVIDNDILPSVPEVASAAAADDKKDDGTAKKDDDKDAAKKDQKDEKKDQADQGFKKRIDDQQKEITQLQRELDVAQREARLRAAAYYADAGVQLRDQTKYAEETRKSQAEIDTKTQALADAKQKLDDLQEQARKAGVPSSEVETPR